MKAQIRTPFTLLILISVISFSMQSCLKDECSEERTFIEFTPVYMMPSQFRVDPVFESERPMENTGKLYFYQDYIFINEKYEGIHIIDNSNPETPQNIGFIRIPGNIDIAIKGQTLYADNYSDLLSIDLGQFDNPRLMCRQQDVFAQYHFEPNRGYLVRMDQTERTLRLQCDDPNFGDMQFVRGGGIFWLEDALNANGGFDAPGTNPDASGTGGSLARFTIAHDFLYVINEHELTAFDLASVPCPDETEKTYVSWGIETLFPYKDYLFIGANNGMYIYDASNPATPQYVSEFRHANACDPVFVKDDIAYVTLRDGNLCQNFTNQLEVVDVSNINSPVLLSTHEMDHPHGLSVRDNNLYICEGEYGLKVFDASDVNKIGSNRIDYVKDIHAFDAISLSSDHLLVIGQDGLYQYDTSDPSNIKEISVIATIK